MDSETPYNYCVLNQRLAFLTGLKCDETNSGAITHLERYSHFEPRVLRYVFDFGCPWNSYGTKLHSDIRCAKVHTIRSTDLEQRDYKWRTPLLLAVGLEGQAIVRKLLECGADVNATDADGNTAMHIAAGNRYCDIIRDLLRFKADPNALNPKGETPLMRGRWIETMRFMLESGANPNIQDRQGDTVLLKACRTGCIDLVVLYLKFGANPTMKNRRGNTPLLWAVRNGHHGCVNLLLIQLKPCEVNARDQQGQTALLEAAGRGYNDATVQLLLDHQADPNARNQQGQSALSLAAVRAHESTVRILLNYQADPNARNRQGQSAIMEVIQQKRKLQNVLSGFTIPPECNGYDRILGLMRQSGQMCI